MPSSAHREALRLLAARDLTTRRLQERLARKGFSEGDIATVIEDLRRQGALDDRRAATTLARAHLRRHRGPDRIVRALEATGIEAGAARAAVHDAMAETGPEALLERAIDRLLTGSIRDVAHLRRLERTLLRLGYPIEEIHRSLSRRCSEEIRSHLDD
jgi:regulatory protein